MRLQPVVLRPLFDRLTDEDPDTPDELPVQRTLDHEGLEASVYAEINRILTTRYVQENWNDPERPDAYGIPDLLDFDPNATQGWPFVENSLLLAIRRYEPRLHNPFVVLQSWDRRTQTVQVSIGGTLETGAVMEPASFPVQVRITPAFSALQETGT
jgi:type VI secretion system lysozyme-like protein